MGFVKRARMVVMNDGGTLLGLVCSVGDTLFLSGRAEWLPLLDPTLFYETNILQRGESN